MTRVRMIDRGFTYLIAGQAVGLLIATTACAQNPLRDPAHPDGAGVPSQSSPQTEVKDLIREAYSRSRQATTIAQYNAVLELCDKVRGYDLTDDNQTYVKKLAAWILNRRGEAFAEEAGQKGAEGDAEAARSVGELALTDFEEAVRLDPAAWRPRQNRGVSYAQIGDYDKALTEFNVVIERYPRYRNAWFNRAEIYFEQGEYEQAIRDYSEAIRLDPQDVHARRGRGHARFELGQFVPALADYSEVVQLEPDNAEALVDRADTQAQLGQWAQAARDYRIAIRLDEDLGRAYENAAWMMATCPAEGFRNTDLALSAAQKALGLNGEDDVRSLDTLAAAKANAGEFEAARELIGKAIELASEDEITQLKARLALYEKDTPFREGMPVN